MISKADAKLIAKEVVKLLQEQCSPGVNMQEEFLTIQGLANYLNMSRRYVELHINEFPHIKIGNRTMFPKSKVLAQILV